MNPKEIERLAKMEQKVIDLEKKIDTHDTQQREDFNKVFKLLNDLPKEMDKIYARKDTVENLRKQVQSDNTQTFQWRQNIPSLILAGIAVAVSIIGAIN